MAALALALGEPRDGRDDRALAAALPGAVRAFVAGLGLPTTLLGVDAVRDGAPVGRDLDERGLLELLQDEEDAVLLLGIVGGQGALLGRGNQQLSPAVLRRLGPDALRGVAGRDKLAALSPGTLHVDTGDAELDRDLAGHVRVRVSARETVLMAVRS
jgi:predicted polyphosphate/ATP-dependent NAD kinase